MTVLVQAHEITSSYVLLKFNYTLKLISIEDDCFTVVKDPSTAIADPFEDITLSLHYNPIARELTLYWNEGVLEPLTDYTLTISGLETTAGLTIPDESIEFTSDDDITITVDSPDDDDDPILVEDHSVLSDEFDTYLISDTNYDFYIVSTDPADGEYYLETDYNDGRVTVTFSAEPADDVEDYIRVQRKIIQRAPARWETLEVEVTKDDKKVYIDFPSLDATPVYYTSGSEYYEEGYEYRIKILDTLYVESATPTMLVEDEYINFAAGLTPLYLAAEEVQAMFPDAPLLEIAKQIYIVSIEVEDLYQLEDDDEPSNLALEYIKAASACALSKVFEYTGGDELSLRLGDLSVTNRNFPKSKINRANATTWCELAAVLRREVLAANTGMRRVVKGSVYRNPIPKRRLKRFR